MELPPAVLSPLPTSDHETKEEMVVMANKKLVKMN
jgi:hypothetical protein